jgi:hypothetical protein
MAEFVRQSASSHVSAFKKNADARHKTGERLAGAIMKPFISDDEIRD